MCNYLNQQCTINFSGHTYQIPVLLRDSLNCEQMLQVVFLSTLSTSTQAHVASMMFVCISEPKTYTEVK